MRLAVTMKLTQLNRILITLICLSWHMTAYADPSGRIHPEKLARIAEAVASYQINPAFKDDAFGLHVVKAALNSARQGSGGIGACLVDATTGQVVETGKNRQYDGYFRSDRHAEMELLNRYEDRMRKKRVPGNPSHLRECPNLVLVSSVEPCPMCLTRIINAGIKTVIWVVADPSGGMASRLDQLPPFWQEFASDREFRLADCSPELRQLAHDLFHLSDRSFAKANANQHPTKIPAQYVTVTDMADRQVTIPANATRIVTTYKPASIIAYCLGLAPRIVGIDTSSRHSPLLRAVYPGTVDITGVGQKSKGINMETLVGLRPDLVILYAQKDGLELADRLAQLGIPAIIILPEKFDSIETALLLMGKATGQEARGHMIYQNMENLLAIADQGLTELPKANRKTGYYASSVSLFSTASGAMIQHQIFSRAGVINVAGALNGYFQNVSPEQLIQWNPQVVLFSKFANPREMVRLASGPVSDIRAVMDGMVFRCPGSLAPWDFPSPLSALAVLWLAKRTYPERFSDLDMMKTTDQFHTLLFNKSFTQMGGRLDDQGLF